jgi:hypothetical protein
MLKTRQAGSNVKTSSQLAHGGRIDVESKSYLTLPSSILPFAML